MFGPGAPVVLRRSSEGVLAVVVLVDPADERIDAEDDAEDGDPEAGRDTEEDDRRRESEPQRPPRVRGEGAVVAGLVLDLAVEVVLGAKGELSLIHISEPTRRS